MAFPDHADRAGGDMFSLTKRQSIWLPKAQVSSKSASVLDWGEHSCQAAEFRSV